MGELAQPYQHVCLNRGCVNAATVGRRVIGGVLRHEYCEDCLPVMRERRAAAMWGPVDE